MCKEITSALSLPICFDRIVFDSDDSPLAAPLFQAAYGFGGILVTSLLSLLLTVEKLETAPFMLPFYTEKSDPALFTKECVCKGPDHFFPSPA